MKQVLVVSGSLRTEQWREYAKVVWDGGARLRFYWPGKTACPDCRAFRGSEFFWEGDLSEGANLLDAGVRSHAWWGFEVRSLEKRVWLTPLYRDPDCQSCHEFSESEKNQAHLSFAARFFEENSRLTGIQHPVKRTASAPKLALPDVEAQTDLERAIVSRRSPREFVQNSNLNEASLRRHLRLACGVTSSSGLRAAPSGGALYGVSAFAIVQRCESLAAGIYEYRAEHDELQILPIDAPFSEVKRHLGYPNLTHNASVIILLAGDLDRVAQVYRDRAYRLLLLEAGHIAQNILLLASQQKISACPLMAFSDDFFQHLLSRKDQTWRPLYSVALG